MTLFQRSIDVILAGQSENGAYVASPTFSQYQACWMRDGALIAYGMNRAGQHESASRFFRWTDTTLTRHRPHVERVLDVLSHKGELAESDYLPTRFTLDGGLMPGPWWDFQLDGYGTWLWALVEHIEHTNDRASLNLYRDNIAYICEYLCALWDQPNYDCWEENRNQIHLSTLSAIYGGLMAVQRLDPTLGTGSVAAQIRDYALKTGVIDGHLTKYVGNSAVDSSLLWSAVPYGLLRLDDPLFLGTLDVIERELHNPNGGVYRYRADVYYGGGEWLLLTAWLGWVYARCGDLDKARALLRWIELQADSDGLLPEQTAEHLLAPEHQAEWITRWGTSAKPLLWSHAMYLVLNQELAHASTKGQSQS
jgi:GH15 family glucan-1,4-alpha-glucosidase